MSLLPEQIAILRGFLSHSDFHRGSVVLDMDGTALWEEAGKVFISGSVEKGVREVTALGRPVIMNTLRFPLSVVRKIAAEWIAMSAPVIHVVLLNGSLTGIIMKNDDDGEICFYERNAYPLSKEEITGIVRGLSELVKNDICNIDLFYYPRDWKKGEIIWVPEKKRVENVRNRYRSANEVYTSDTDELLNRLLSEDICMMSSFVDHPQEILMTYQHKNPRDFFTAKGIDKSFGTRELARRLNISLMDSLGGGDTVMDRFLCDTGLAVIVGDETNHLDYRGRRETLWVRDPVELGELLVTLSEIVKEQSGLSIPDYEPPEKRPHFKSPPIL